MGVARGDGRGGAPPVGLRPPFIPFESLRTGFDFPQHERPLILAHSYPVLRPSGFPRFRGGRLCLRRNDEWGVGVDDTGWALGSPTPPLDTGLRRYGDVGGMEAWGVGGRWGLGGAAGGGEGVA